MDNMIEDLEKQVEDAENYEEQRQFTQPAEVIGSEEDAA